MTTETAVDQDLKTTLRIREGDDHRGKRTGYAISYRFSILCDKTLFCMYVCNDSSTKASPYIQWTDINQNNKLNGKRTWVKTESVKRMNRQVHAERDGVVR